jgi:peptidoglycan hydrolase-like protein with peptidoglycan-binding domain
LGSKGAEVKCLQVKLGLLSDGRFGPLTKTAVKKFQAEHGLVADGIVGPLSRAELNKIYQTGLYPEGCTSTFGFSSTTGARCDGGSDSTPISISRPQNSSTPGSLSGESNTSSVDVNINPNLEHLNQFVENVVEVNRENGSSEQELKLIADTLRKTVINSNMDYKKEFIKVLERDSQLSFHHQPNVFDKIITNTLSFFGIIPSVAEAQSSTPAFGGVLTFSFFCAYNSSWMITVVLNSVPPKIWVLTYYPGTQGFASYNIPFTTYLLGLYSPPGVCVIPAGPAPITITTQGTITPVVGSSPL